MFACRSAPLAVSTARASISTLQHRFRLCYRFRSDMAEPKQVPIPPNGVDYRGKIVLAPMVRSGELPSRLMALKYGADLVWGPETVDKAMIGTTRRVNPLTKMIEFTRFSSNKLAPPQDSEGDNSSSNPTAVDPSADGPPCGRESIIFSIDPVQETQAKKLIFQLGTATPELAVEAAKLVAADVAGIDVNSGCPKPFSTSGGMGAALLRDPERLCSILRALVAEVGTPFGIGISVKIRILKTEGETLSLVSRLVKTGITGITVHCRMPHMRPRERAIRDQFRAIAATCRAAGVACLINGDVKTRKEGLALMKEFEADGAMIATAAEKNPSVFLPSGMISWRRVVPDYVTTAIQVANRWGNTKFLLSQIIPGKSLQASLPEDAPITCLAAAKKYEQLVSLLSLPDADAETEAEAADPGMKKKDSALAEERSTNLLESGGSAQGSRSTSTGSPSDCQDALSAGMPFPFDPELSPSILARARALDHYLGLGGQVSKAEKKAQRTEEQEKEKEEAKIRREEKLKQWLLRKEASGASDEAPCEKEAAGIKVPDENENAAVLSSSNGKRASDDECSEPSKRVCVASGKENTNVKQA